jgi:hypothetical protein
MVDGSSSGGNICAVFMPMPFKIKHGKKLELVRKTTGSLKVAQKINEK